MIVSAIFTMVWVIIPPISGRASLNIVFESEGSNSKILSPFKGLIIIKNKKIVKMIYCNY
jgi:hypothetical protein